MSDAALLRLAAGQVKVRNRECGTPQRREKGGPPGGGRGPGGPIGSARGKGDFATPTVRVAVMVSRHMPVGRGRLRKGSKPFPGIFVQFSRPIGHFRRNAP